MKSRENVLTRIRKDLVPPLLVFLLARIVLMAAADFGGHDPFDPNVWLRQDGTHYVSIAERGYELFPCSPGSKDWCGNSAWPPGYPWLIVFLSLFGFSAVSGGLVLSGAFNLLNLIFIWKVFLHSSWKLSPFLCLLVAGFFPGQLYHHATFPISTLLFFTLSFVYFLLKERWLAAGFSGAAASFTYPMGVVLAAVAGVWMVLSGAIKQREKAIRLCATAALVVVGFASIMMVHQVSVGAWDAFFKVRAKYSHGVQSPFAGWVSSVTPFLEDVSPNKQFIVMKAHNQRYVCAEGGGGTVLVANRGGIGIWETFQLIEAEEGRVALRTHNGQYVSAKSDERGLLIADGAAAGTQETFQLLNLGGDRFALQAFNGKFVSPDPEEIALVPGPVGKQQTFEKMQITNGLFAGMQTVWVTCWVGILLINFAIRRMHRHAADRLVLIYVLVLWIFGLVIAALSSFRAESVLLPSVVLGRNLPAPLLGAAALLAAYIAFHMADLFYRGLLV